MRQKPSSVYFKGFYMAHSTVSRAHVGQPSLMPRWLPIFFSEERCKALRSFDIWSLGVKYLLVITIRVLISGNTVEVVFLL